MQHFQEMTETVFREKFILEPRFIDSNIHNHVAKLVKLKKEGTCSKKCGYIKRVTSTKIIGTEISMADSSNIIYVEYQVEAIKPVVGQKYQSTQILYSNESRVLVDMDGMFQILIINGTVKNGVCRFDGCSCRLIVDTPPPHHLSDILLKVVEFKDGKFITIGVHDHTAKN